MIITRSGHDDEDDEDDEKHANAGVQRNEIKPTHDDDVIGYSSTGSREEAGYSYTDMTSDDYTSFNKWWGLNPFVL